MPRNPSPNADRQRRNSPLNQTVAAVPVDPELVEAVMRSVGDMCPQATRFARAVLSSPQAAVYTPAEVALVEVAARALHRWVTDPEAKAALLSQFSTLCDRLMVSRHWRMKAHLEVLPDAQPVPEVDEIEERRRLRERFG